MQTCVGPADPEVHLLEVWEFGKVEGPFEPGLAAIYGERACQ